MAYSAAANPVVVSWAGNSAPPVITVSMEANSATSKIGQLLLQNGASVKPVGASAVQDAQYILCENYTNTTSATNVAVQQISEGTRLLMNVCNGSATALENAVTVNSKYGVYTASNITYLDKAKPDDHANNVDCAFKVLSMGSSIDAINMTTTLNSGCVLVEYVGTTATA